MLPPPTHQGTTGHLFLYVPAALVYVSYGTYMTVKIIVKSNSHHSKNIHSLFVYKRFLIIVY